MPDRGRPKLVAIVGATASGKSITAIEVAKVFGGEVINADSRLFYRGMDIGTAKPSTEELSSVPHHLVSSHDPAEPFSLAEFLSLANSLIREIWGRGKLPLLAGGTGQYVWGLLEGWQVPKVAPDADLRAELELKLTAEGVEALFDELERIAPEVAANTDQRNHRRIIRAIERVATGESSMGRKAADPGFDALVIGLKVDRAELHRRIEERISHMIASGWIDEVTELLDRGLSHDAPAMSAIGYREMAAHIRGEMTLEEARRRTIVATNRLVRHQNNWFKPTDDRVRWVDMSGGGIEKVKETIKEWLAR